MGIIQNISLLIKLNKILQEVKEMLKKGNWFSTEFILNVLTILGSIAAAVVGFIPVVLVAKGIAILVIVYTVGRSIAKLTTTTKDDEIVEKIGNIIKNLGGQVPENK
jgi:uncharacterized membrane protein